MKEVPNERSCPVTKAKPPRSSWTNIVNNKLMPIPPNLGSLQPEINVFLVNR
jgi:hypothetical protein